MTDHVAVDIPAAPQPAPKCPVQAADIRYAYAKLAVQAALSVMGIAVSTGMLATREGVEGMYLPVITAVLGYWLPSPTFPVRRSQTA